MSDGCKSALGGKWNLNDGKDSLLGRVDSTAFTDANNPWAFASFTPMYYWTADPALKNFFISTTLFLQSVGVGFYSFNRNTIVVGAIFDKMNQDQQNLALIHEILHAYTGKDDKELAQALVVCVKQNADYRAFGGHA